jgi:hypothetical protein
MPMAIITLEGSLVAINPSGICIILNSVTRFS